MLHLVNKYMDEYLADHTDLSAKAKAEKYAKITAKTIISSGGTDSSSYGQNAFFYDAAEGVLTAAINLTLKKKNHFLLIEVENSFDGKVIWEDGGIVPMTTKQSDLPDILMEHGIGLKNVKNVADHYLGDMDIKIKNDVFKVTVMLQQKEIK